MRPINKSDLRYFTGQALTGLCANPAYSSVQGQAYLRSKKLTVEKLAVSSALETLENLSVLEEHFDKLDAEERAKTEAGVQPPTPLHKPGEA